MPEPRNMVEYPLFQWGYVVATKGGHPESKPPWAFKSKNLSGTTWDLENFLESFH